MTRLVSIACLVLLGGFGPGVLADDPPAKLTPQERKAQEAKWKELMTTGVKAYRAGKPAEATKAFEAALEVSRGLYPREEFPDGHANLVLILHNLAFVYQSQGKYAAAEPFCKDALAMTRRLFKGDHPNVATSLENLAGLYRAQGKYAAAEPLCKEVLAMYKRLFKGDHPDVALSLNNLAELYRAQGNYAAAGPLFKDALEMYRRLFKGDHRDIALCLNNIAELYRAQGKHAAAEPLYKDALEMYKRLFKGDHPAVATGLNNLAELYRAQGKYAAAEPLYKDALAMHQRLFKGDDPAVATSLNNLAELYRAQRNYEAAEPLIKDALEMCKRLFKGDHPAVATGLNNLAELYRAQGKYAAAEPLSKDALAMYKRLFKDDHPDVALSLNNLAALYYYQGKYASAEPLHKESLAMYRRLFKGDHPDVARILNNLAELHRAQGKYVAAEPVFKDALAMYRRLTTAFARDRSEGEALTLVASLPSTIGAFLSCALAHKADPATVYPSLWFEKGALTRVHEFRQLQARAAAADPRVAPLFAELTRARRRRAELLLAPTTNDSDAQKQIDQDIKTLEKRIEDLMRIVRLLLPAIARADKLAKAEPSALQKLLPADAVVVDYLRFVRYEQDPDTPGEEGKKRTDRYLAVVVTREKIAWVELDKAETIEKAVTAWREAITGGKEIAPALPAKVRELVWERVRQELPASIKTVYVCPDAALCRVPFAALPGKQPGSILLDDYAVATIPHAIFLLDRLMPQDPRQNPPTEALVVGGVKYEAEGIVVAGLRGEPLVKPGAKLGWPFLRGTVAEANGFQTAAQRQKLSSVRLEGEKATTAAVLAALPRAKVAHLATHGFFADPSFRGLFQLDEREYRQAPWGERIGRVANSPLLMTGLVFAGANQEKTPGRGILTGEALIDLDLSGLELVVLSACETGLGDVAGGEGTFGLQRAFHLAGTHNVVASLWKVPDEPTAALMGLFYRNLWEHKQPPLEALRQAQLEIYKNPGKVPELAKSFRGTFKVVPGSGGEVITRPSKDSTAHPLFWAAFSLSGLGR